MEAWVAGNALQILSSRGCTYLFVQLHESGFELFSDVFTIVIGILHVTETLAWICLVRQELPLDLPGQGVQRHWHVLGVSDFFELDVGDFLVANICGIVCGHVTWKFWEV